MQDGVSTKPKTVIESSDGSVRVGKKGREEPWEHTKKWSRDFLEQGRRLFIKKYSEDKGEDYLWWLDLKFVLCIELYTLENDIQKDPADAKNFCYVMQAHSEMLGIGSAFVVARPPKGAFREAKANEFHVTVIRKGEIKLNIDQTLEEVEEKLLEIGNKMYRDKIMRERSVDMGTLMKGVFASGKSKKRRIPRTLAKNNYSANVKQSHVDRK